MPAYNSNAMSSPLELKNRLQSPQRMEIRATSLLGLLFSISPGDVVTWPVVLTVNRFSFVSRLRS